jgi:2-polyprenyl-3-methyl-5-hydroxy-6-metoxy-1,4-benzoquinol methylase
MPSSPENKSLHAASPGTGARDPAAPEPRAASAPGGRKLIATIVAAYDHPLVRWYSRVRFVILRQRFLDEIGQYLPERGRVVDVGCGFGLFALYFAATHPGLTIRGIDLDEARIAMAQRAAARLGLRNASFERGDATRLNFDEPVDGVYMLDIIHHVPRSAVQPLVETIAGALASDGILVVKDVDARPFYKMAFTWALDKLMDWRAGVSYWHSADFSALLRERGFRTYSHAMLDFLPYPHVLYVARPRR